METADSDTSMGQARCPQCGNHLPVHALAGLCPACLLGQGACETQANTAVSAFVPPSIEEIAPLFPNLEILELIGRGGMGAVYKAHQTALDRTVALKILPSATSHDPAFSERFTREARALAKLNHPGIVTLYESGRAGDLCFFLMEFVDGVNLRQILTGDRLSTREALAIVPRICDALQYAHDQGIVHRDIKPENILLDRLGNVKIADFGLAKLVGPELQSLSNTTGTSEFTIAGNLMGTPAYMAPEQMDHPSGVDHRADIYALGVVIYQMLTGELPDQPLVPPSRTMQIDVRLDEVVVRALQRKPELRFQQADDLKTMIEEISKSTHAMTARPRSKRLIGIPGTLLVLCLPLSIVIPVVSRQKKPEMHHTAALFASRNPGDRQLVEDLLKSSLGGFPGVSLKRNRTRDQWSIELAGEDREKIQDQMTELVYFVTGALDGTSDDPLTEPARFESFQTISDSVGSWTTNRTFVSTLRSWSLAGSVFSAFGLLLLTFPRRPFSTPIARIPGIVALGLLVLGCYAAFSLRLHGIMHREVLVAAILTGVPALLLGIAGHSDRFGRIVAAFAWLGILLAGRDVFLSLPPPSAPERWINIPLTADAVAPPRKARFLTERIRSKGSAVSSWLEQIDAGNYSEPWNLLSNTTQSLESQATWTDRTRAIRTSLGDLVTRKLVQSATTWQGEKAAEEQILTYTFQSSFTLRSEVRETVILGLQRDGKWRISGYFIK